MEWCKIIAVEDIQFLVSKNFKEMYVSLETQNRSQGYIAVNFQCQNGREMDEAYNEIEGEEAWHYYQEALASFN
jgi:hypothetical protein